MDHVSHINIPPTMIAASNMMNAFQTGAATLMKYINAYLVPTVISMNNFGREEHQRLCTREPLENISAYMKLLQMNVELISLSTNGSIQAFGQMMQKELQNVLPMLTSCDSEGLARFAQRMNMLAKDVAYTYPAAVDGIGNEFGFHFERQPPDSKIDETERFELFQVLPNKAGVKVRMECKPLLIIPPVVLGANILSFLPGDHRSYAHAFANEGIPTYIRIYKDIDTCEAVQLITLEEDTMDTKRFCAVIKQRHQAPVTLNGYCQGGYAGLCSLLSGELDDLVDAFITCVAPMDGTRSKGLKQFLNLLPPIFNDLAYGLKVLPNGNQVVNGILMGWIYKLKNIEMETPMLALWRDMMIVENANGNCSAINKTAAALNYWLMYERNDFPLEITRASFASYNTPISKDGTLPIKLFGRPLNLKRIKEKKLPWLICYGLQDDLVEPETALAPLDYVDAEVTPFPKGHVAIATSWSHPDTAHALHKKYEDNTTGPVRFQLDLQEELIKSQIKKSKAPAPPKKTKAGANPSAVPKSPPKPPKAPKTSKQSKPSKKEE